MTTRAELVRMTLDLLNVVGIGLDPSAEDADIVDRAIDGKIQDLRARNVIDIYDVATFDDGLSEWLAQVLAQTVASKFGLTPDAQATEYAETQIKRHRPTVLSGKPARIEYF